MSMESPIFWLPTELHQSIVFYLIKSTQSASQSSLPRSFTSSSFAHTHRNDLSHIPTLVALGSTCRHFRSICMPLAVRTLALFNTDSCAQHFGFIRQSEFASSVREVRIYGWVLGVESISCGDTYDQDMQEYGYNTAFIHPQKRSFVFPSSFENELRSLRNFEGLHKLVVMLISDFVSRGGMTLDGVEHAFDEDHESVETAEASNSWRMLMAQTWATLINHSPSTVTTLEIPKITYAAVSTFSETRFDAFLSQLKQFRMSLESSWGVFNHAPTTPGLTHNLGPRFFNRLPHVEELDFDATEHCFLGKCEGNNLLNIGFANAHLPMLTRLKLGHLFICAELRDFVFEHLPKLELFTLDECYACGLGDADTWTSLFKIILQKKPTRLVSFLIVSKENQDELLDLWWEKRGLHPISEELKDLGDRIKRTRLLFPERMALPYGEVIRWGEMSIGESKQHFIRGDDWRLFKEVEETVHQNGRTTGKASKVTLHNVSTHTVSKKSPLDSDIPH